MTTNLPEKVTIRVPATTANLGPGFDCLGMALELYLTLTAVRSRSPRFTITGEGARSLVRTRDNLLHRAMATLCARVEREMPALELSCQNEIPLKRGLGSSAAAIVGGLVAANVLCGKPLTLRELLSVAAELEGHADNVAPALLGGCQLVVWENQRVTAFPVPLPSTLQVVLFIPDFEMPTKRARAILPREVALSDAVYNLSRTALLVAALSQGDTEYMRLATQDRLHQPRRQLLFPAMPRLFEAALGAGAAGAFLSGAGSSIVALATDQGDRIARALAEAAAQEGLSGRTQTLRPSLAGAEVVSEE